MPDWCSPLVEACVEWFGQNITVIPYSLKSYNIFNCHALNAKNNEFSQFNIFEQIDSNISVRSTCSQYEGWSTAKSLFIYHQYNLQRKCTYMYIWLNHVPVTCLFWGVLLTTLWAYGKANLNRRLFIGFLGSGNPFGPLSASTDSRLRDGRKGELRLFIRFLLCPGAVYGSTSVVCHFSSHLVDKAMHSELWLHSLPSCASVPTRWQHLPSSLDCLAPPYVALSGSITRISNTLYEITSVWN